MTAKTRLHPAATGLAVRTHARAAKYYPQFPLGRLSDDGKFKNCEKGDEDLRLRTCALYIKQKPDFCQEPYLHYLKAVCLRDSGYPGWWELFNASSEEDWRRNLGQIARFFPVRFERRYGNGEFVQETGEI